MATAKISDDALKSENRFHVCLSDVPNLAAEDMKEFLDYIPRRVIIPKINEIIDNKPDRDETVTPEQLVNKADADAVYTKEETDSLLLDKAGLGEVYLTDETYSKEETDDLLSGKADAAELKKHISETDGISAELDELKQLTGLPDVTTEDDGKMLRVVDGVWSAVMIASAEEGSF